MEKGKGKLIEHVKLSNVQASINIDMQQIDEISKDRLGLFDKWVEYWMAVHFETIRNEKKLNVVDDIDDKILIWAETELLFEALQRKEFIELELCENVLREIIKQKRENFKSHSLQDHDDSAVIQ